MHDIPPYMGDLSDEDIAWVAANGIRESVPAGAAIIHEGVPLDAVFVILEGSFIVSGSTLGDDLIPELGKGELAGEMSYIHRHLPLSTVRATVDSVVLRISRERLDEKIQRDAAFAGRFWKVLSEFTVDRIYNYNLARRTPPVPPEDHRPPLDPKVEERLNILIKWMLGVGSDPAPGTGAGGGGSKRPPPRSPPQGEGPEEEPGK